MSERPNVHAWKACVRKHRRFESASLRQTKKCATLVSQQTGFACFFVFRRIKANFCLLCVSHTNRLLGGDARALLCNGFLSQITSRYWRFASACYESASLRQTKKCATLVSQQTGFACFFVLTLYWRYKVG